MVTLPPPFVAIQYPGYFWNVQDKQLYTLKVSGILRPLKPTKACFENQQNKGYQISVNGKRLYLHEADLLRLRLVDSVIPVADGPQLLLPFYTVPTYNYSMGRHFNPPPSSYRNH